MKNRIVISVGLIILGFVFECLHFMTTISFFEIKFWLLGIVCMVAGGGGVIWYFIIPLLENRAETLGRFKKKSISKFSKK